MQGTGKKFFLGVLVTSKNEGMVMKEWLDHYLWQGVDHFYFIDNDSSDNTTEILKPYIESGVVSYFWMPAKYAQARNYNALFPECKRDCEWLAVIDMDEYVYARKPDTTIASVLKENPSANCVQLNWRFFGSSGHDKQPDCIRTSFTKAGSKLHPLEKCIIRTSDCSSLHVHKHSIRRPVTLHNPDSLALNHYGIMSWEYFEKTKIPRGDVIHRHHEHTRNRGYFETYDGAYSDVENLELANLVRAANLNK